MKFIDDLRTLFGRSDCHHAESPEGPADFLSKRWLFRDFRDQDSFGPSNHAVDVWEGGRRVDIGLGKCIRCRRRIVKEGLLDACDEILSQRLCGYGDLLGFDEKSDIVKMHRCSMGDLPPQT